MFGRRYFAAAFFAASYFAGPATTPLIATDGACIHLSDQRSPTATAVLASPSTTIALSSVTAADIASSTTGCALVCTSPVVALAEAVDSPDVAISTRATGVAFTEPETPDVALTHSSTIPVVALLVTSSGCSTPATTPSVTLTMRQC